MSPLDVGTIAPDFELRDQHGQPVRLSSYLGVGRVLLVFYPFAFSRVCSQELRALRDVWEELARPDLAVLAVSCDPRFALREYAEREQLPFALLSDFWPHGAVARAYGVLDEQGGAARRSSFLIDESGKIIWSLHSPGGVGRDPGVYLQAIANGA